MLIEYIVMLQSIILKEWIFLIRFFLRPAIILIQFPIIFLAGQPPRITEDLPRTLAVVTGESWTLRCRVSGKPTPQIIWFKDRREIIDSTKYRMTYDGTVASLHIHDTVERDMGRYTCEAVNSLGSASTQTTLSVESK